MTACPDSPVGRDPGKVSVSQLAQHGPRHLVGLGQERERCALVIALVVLGCLLRLGDEVGDLAPELGVAGGLPEPPGRIDTGPQLYEVGGSVDGAGTGIYRCREFGVAHQHAADVSESFRLKSAVGRKGEGLSRKLGDVDLEHPRQVDQD